MTYSSSIAIGRQRYGSRNQNITSQRPKGAAIGPVSNSILLIVLACILGVLYLAQVTKTNAYGYKINELQTAQSSLQTEHDELEVAAARLQSIERIKSSPAASGLVSVAPAATLQN